MSSSSAIGFSGQKMSFSQTCNLLSQYVKEKRALGGPATMNLFPVNEKQTGDESSVCVGRTINLFPQLSGLDSRANKRASPEPPAAQMTIFYGGQVLVFNDLPADKAKEVMDLASSFESSLKKRKVEATVVTSPSPVAVPVSALNAKTNMSPNPNPNQNQNSSLNVAPSVGNDVIPAAVPRTPVPIVSDLPIARKASLHRFLEKRKDRLVGKAPPNVSNEGASKPVEGKAWLGLNSLPIFQQQQQQQQL